MRRAVKTGRRGNFLPRRGNFLPRHPVGASAFNAFTEHPSFLWAPIQVYRTPIILDLQLGDQGWCTNADTLFVRTGVATYFGGVYERHQAYIDGGLFAMNFIYGLHLQHIATCFKMFVRNPKVMKDFRKTCNIQENEIPIVLILAGHYSEESSECPVSSRFTVSCMLDGKDIS